MFFLLLWMAYICQDHFSSIFREKKAHVFFVAQPGPHKCLESLHAQNHNSLTFSQHRVRVFENRNFGGLLKRGTVLGMWRYMQRGWNIRNFGYISFEDRKSVV